MLGTSHVKISLFKLIYDPFRRALYLTLISLLDYFIGGFYQRIERLESFYSNQICPEKVIEQWGKYWPFNMFSNTFDYWIDVRKLKKNQTFSCLQNNLCSFPYFSY